MKPMFISSPAGTRLLLFAHRSPRSLPRTVHAGEGVMSGYGPGIRRGAMAADRFTQIRNDLFRDSKMKVLARHGDGSLPCAAARLRSLMV
ncbi:hypothetical protein [Streptomyces sp. NPDC092129]|uniref:hypothetical protein n=1 Tax=Streptomyces sp. NPDC092129 TaxID=3366010 RepID=UPI0038006816